MQENINGYSLALFSIAKEEKKLKQFKEQSQLIIDSLIESDGYENILSSNSITIEEKQGMLKKAFTKGLNKNLLNFLLILVEKNRFKIVRQVLFKLIKFINEDLNINEGIVYTPIKLMTKDLKAIELRTGKLLSTKVTLVNKIDAELISGFKVVVGDEIIEDTISSRLEDIKNQLLRKENNAS